MIRFYIKSCAIIVFLAGAGKLVNVAFGSISLLHVDPLVGVPYGWIMVFAAVLELVVFSYCVFSRNNKARFLGLFCLSLVFLMYRALLWALDWHQPCACVGSLAHGIGLSTRGADVLSKFLLFYMVSFGLLILSLGASSESFGEEPNKQKNNTEK